MLKRQHGQTSAEYLGALLLVSVLIAAVALTDVGSRIEYHARILVCRIAGGTDCGKLAGNPITGQVAAVSCGLWEGTAVLDLDYDEDSKAEADANFVLTGSGSIVEVQGTAEKEPFSEAQFVQLMELAKKGVGELTQLQRLAIGQSGAKSG